MDISIGQNVRIKPHNPPPKSLYHAHQKVKLPGVISRICKTTGYFWVKFANELDKPENEQIEAGPFCVSEIAGK